MKQLTCVLARVLCFRLIRSVIFLTSFCFPCNFAKLSKMTSLIKQSKLLQFRPALSNSVFASKTRLFSNEPPARTEKTVNTITVLGRVGADPQLRGNAQHPVVTFSVATHQNYKYENGDWAQRTDWHRIVVFKPNLRDTVMEYLKKGQRTMVQGKITYGEITDQQGNQKPSTSIIADDVIFFRESQ